MKKKICNDECGCECEQEKMRDGKKTNRKRDMNQEH